MIQRSIKTQIFAAVTIIMALVAGVVMTSSQRAIERELVASEELRTRSVLSLVEENIRTRYRSWLRDKVATVAEHKALLRDFDRTAIATLQQFADLASKGKFSEAQAQAQALHWLAAMSPAEGGYMVVFDRTGRRLLSPGSVGELTDFKERSIVAAALDETERYGESFLIFHDSAAGSKFGHFAAFERWGWVIGAIADLERLKAEVAEQRADVEIELSEMLPLVLERERGSVFVFAADGKMIVPPRTVLDPALLASLPELKRRAGEVVQVTSAAGEAFDARVAYVRALDWYIASFVSREAMLAPVDRLLRHQAVIFLFALVLGLLFAYFFSDRIARPLNKLAAYAMGVPEMDFSSGLRAGPQDADLPVRRGDEVGRLARAFAFMEDAIAANVRSLMSETAVRERMEGELGVAREIQTGLLPSVFPPFPDRSEVDLFAVLEPAREVGGDLFDFFFIDEHRLCFAIGDVSGKGVPAALFMAITTTLIRVTAEQESDAATIVTTVNAALSRDNPNCFFVTLLLGILDVSTGSVTCTAAGHLPPIICGPNGARLLDLSAGPAAGAIEGVRYESRASVVAEGETLVLYTDGVTEAMDADNRLYGDARLRELLARLPAGLHARQVVERVVSDVGIHEAGGAHADDLTVLAVRYLGSSPRDPGVLEACK